MGRKNEIREEITSTRNDILETVDNLSDKMHKKFSLGEKFKNDPLAAVAITIALGAGVALVTRPAATMLIRFLVTTGTSIAGAYVARSSRKFFTKKFKI